MCNLRSDVIPTPTSFDLEAQARRYPINPKTPPQAPTPFMALATAATAAAVSLHPLLTRPACVLRFGRRLTPHLLRATSSASSAPDFNITFAEPAPAKKASSPAPSAQPLVPWIVRGEDRKPRLSTSPPPEVLQAIALAEAEAKKAAKKESLKGQKGAVAAAAAASSAGVKTKERKAAPAAPPKFSKAARRFYNENIKEREPQRLAKVLAAAGGSPCPSVILDFKSLACIDTSSDSLRSCADKKLGDGCYW